MGSTAEAEAAARRALQLDPVNTARYRELAWVLALGGRFDEAQREIDRALALNPRSFETFFLKGWTHELAGQPDAAFAAYREGLHLNGVPEDALRRVETIYRSEGLAGYYRGWLNARPRSDSTPISDTWRAMIEARVGDRDKAIESLRQAYRKREGALAWVNVEPSFRALRSDPRFQQIASRSELRTRGSPAEPSADLHLFLRTSGVLAALASDANRGGVFSPREPEG